MSRSIVLFALLCLLCCTLSSAIPLRSLFLRSYGDMNQEAVSRGYFNTDANLNDETSDGSDNRSKRGLDLLKRRVEIIERNRCFFNPITCY